MHSYVNKSYFVASFLEKFPARHEVSLDFLKIIRFVGMLYIRRHKATSSSVLQLCLGLIDSLFCERQPYGGGGYMNMGISE